MLTVVRAKLPRGSKQVSPGVWVHEGRVYKKTKEGFLCEGAHKVKKEKVKKPHSKNRRGTLTEESVAYIKGQIAAHANQEWLRRKFNVSSVTVHNIGRGRIWERIETPEMELEGPPKGIHKLFWDEYIEAEELDTLKMDEP